MGITPVELVAWHDVASRLVTGLDVKSGLLEQFAGFFQLEPIDLTAYRTRTAPMDVLLGRERIQRSQVIKQADVVMLLALLWERYPAELRAANFHYYEPRCGHGSSLSPAMHALVAARLGEVALAARYFQEAASIDLTNTMGNAAGGIHIATLGGLWQATVLGFGGVSFGVDRLRCNPHLPTAWRTLQFPVRWRERTVRLVIRQAPLTVTVTVEQGPALLVEVGDRCQQVSTDRPWSCRWNQATQRWEEVNA
jgi:kojibiose phosphorylase